MWLSRGCIVRAASHPGFDGRATATEQTRRMAALRSGRWSFKRSLGEVHCYIVYIRPHPLVRAPVTGYYDRVDQCDQS